LSSIITIVIALVCLSRNDGRISLPGIGNIVRGKQATEQSVEDITVVYPTSSPTITLTRTSNDDDGDDGNDYEDDESDSSGTTPENTSTTQGKGDYEDVDDDDQTAHGDGDKNGSNSDSSTAPDKEGDTTKEDEKNDDADTQGGHEEEEEDPKEKEDSTETDTNASETEEETRNDHMQPQIKYTEEKYTTDILPWSKGPLTEEEKDAMIEKWGKWHFWDGDPESRPTEDYMAPFPNRDCPYEEFPDTAWQADAVYVNHMLDSAGELVARAKEAIYTEYGYGPRSELDHDQLKIRMDMFKLSLIDLDDDSAVPNSASLTQGGWTTKRSLRGLVRRLIHAMMTNDTFTIVLGGHSAAAGHGNHFLQSYMMQMYKVLEPIFNRVGVKLIVRNLAQGGLGTMQHSLGSSSIYGDNVDVLVWDSSMTEKDKNAIDLFYRQALIGGKRAPLLWGGPFDLLKNLYRFADGKLLY
jgi:Cobalamin biosynthesis protein CobT (nicotinate-mononucleotide:5, 6-dimethylbenzimidazole phosphoribosyltransferase)